MAKLAVPLPPSAELSAAVKPPTVPVKLVGAPPSTEIVPASKSTSTRETRLPLESATAIVVLPVKFSASVDSRPVLRPAIVAGGGKAVLALCLCVVGERRLRARLPSSLRRIGEAAVAHIHQAFDLAGIEMRVEDLRRCRSTSPVLRIDVLAS